MRDDDGVVTAVGAGYVGVSLAIVYPLLAIAQVPELVGVAQFQIHREAPMALSITLKGMAARAPVVKVTYQVDGIRGHGDVAGIWAA